MSGMNVKIDKFTGRNSFSLWQIKMRALLKQQGLWAPLARKLADPIIAEMAVLEEKAHSTIMLCLVDDIITEVAEEETTQGMPLRDHLDQLNTILLELRNIDVKVEDEDAALILLVSLPLSYENFVQSFIVGKDTVSLEEVRSSLHTRELRHKATGTGANNQAAGLVASGSYGHGNSGKKKFKKPVSKGPKSNDVCNYCKEKGHWKSDCPKKKRQQDKPTGTAAVADTNYEEDIALVADEHTDHNDVWILDSGASYHICPRREWFTTYEQVDGGNISMANSSVCKAVGISSIKIRTHDGKFCTLNDVRHVPLMTKNLISLSMLDNKGFSFQGEGGVLHVCKGSNVVLKRVKRGTLYFLQGSTLSSSVAVASSEIDKDSMTKLWHMRLGHMSARRMQILSKGDLLCGHKVKDLEFCEHCIFGKLHRSKFPKAIHRTKGTLDYIHSDCWGPSRVESLGGHRYFVSMIDDFSRMTWVFIMKHKSEAFKNFRQWKALVENQTGKKIKRLRTDNGLEFYRSEFDEFCKNEGIARHHTVRDTPQQNGVAERMNQTLLERARCMLSNAELTRRLWAEAVSTACYLINRGPHTGIHLKTPFEVWSGKPADYSNLRAFGCTVYYHVNEGKLEPRAKKRVFVGYGDGVKGYRIWSPFEMRVILSRNVVFDENSMFNPTVKSIVVSENGSVEKQVEQQVTLDESEPQHKDQHHSQNQNHQVTEEVDTDSNEPSTYKEAVTCTESTQWLAVMRDEMESLHKNQTWELTKVLLAIVAHQDLELEQLDVKTAFLHGELEEEIYMTQPDGFQVPGKEDYVCKLKKSLYGLKQSPRQWYKRFDSYMIEIGYTRSPYDCCVYYSKATNGSLIYLVLYVDDMLIAAENKSDVQKLKDLLSVEFEMKDLGVARKILGMEIYRERSKKKLFLSQKGYIQKILSRFGMSTAKPIDTPSAANAHLSVAFAPKSVEEKEYMSRVPYASAVGSLMYAMICTRPDLAQSVSVVSRFMGEPGKEHWQVVKRIFRYLKGTFDVGLIYGGDTQCLVTGFSDFDYAGDVDSRRSMTGYVFTLGSSVVSWKATLQPIVTLSTTEAEYMALTEAAKEEIWLKGLVSDLGLHHNQAIVYCDSLSAICLAKDQVHHERTKHIDVRSRGQNILVDWQMQLEAVGVDKISYPEEMRKKDSEAFESRMLVVRDMLNSLSNLDVKIVGVFGMGGVGKIYNMR
ncbi:Retrovirus-related Pol polyprotein from transposon TNT 1-94 [Melia azedarach]|uniref:Retrovirus-related Pol polyprotein from transposon TNT 1-94 n=1 Tax=Melia azedarach TaxID=155640 RepID=A0ACC1YEZ4_MELAZ|nr:Retrovirus-related Pol polyprotein from transposon TNT 1-94 [Melia azedarach]